MRDWFMSQYPLVAGHEVIGEVVAIGSDVAAFEVGDRVGLGWHSDYCQIILKDNKGKTFRTGGHRYQVI